MHSVGVLLRSFILVEGFKHEPVAKILLFREGAGRDVAELMPDSHVIALASDIPLPGVAQTVLDINEPAQVAAFIADWLTAQRAQGSSAGMPGVRCIKRGGCPLAPFFLTRRKAKTPQRC